MFALCFRSLLLILLLPGAVHGDMRWQSPLLGYAEFPPFTFENERAEADGSIIDAARGLFASISLQPAYRALPPARLFQELERGRLDGWFGIVVPRIETLLLFSARPLASIALSLYRLPDRPDKPLADIKPDQALVLIHGWSYGGRRKELIESHTTYDAPNNKAAFQMLELGRADYLLSYDEVVQASPDRPENLLQRPIENIQVYFQLRRDFPDAEAIMQAFDLANSQ